MINYEEPLALMRYSPIKEVKDKYVLYESHDRQYSEYCCVMYDYTFTLIDYIDEKMLEFGYLKGYDYTCIAHLNSLTYFFRGKILANLFNIVEKYFILIDNGINIEYFLSLV